MRSLHYPTASLESGFGQLVVSLFTPLLDVWLIVPLNDCFRCRRALVARIGAEIILPRSTRHLHHELVQRGFEQFYVMCVCAAGDERERDANPVDQQASFAPIFSPYPWGWGPRIRLQAALCASRRRCSASSMQWLPSRRTRPVRHATDERRSRPAAISGSANVQHWGCQTRVEEPSTGNRCATRKRWRKRFGAAAWACDRHQVYEDKRDPRTAVGQGSTAQPSPKTHLRQSMT
jgi:hypothetical protein